MRQSLRAALTAGSLAGLAAVAGCSTAGASPSSQARGGAETLVLTTGSAAADPVYSVAARGIFQGAGRVTGIGDGKNASLVTLPGGTFRISHPVSGEQTGQRQLNRKTCAVLVTESGSFTLSNGTGKFQGISGFGTDHGQFTATLPRRASGSCETSSSATPVKGSVHVTITAPATVLIPPRSSTAGS
jgi:hypothetical protein